MFIPIRSEKDVRKIPNVTIGLIFINFIIWIVTNHILGDQMKVLETIHEQMVEIETRYIMRDLSILNEKSFEAIHERFLKEEIIPPNSEDYKQFRNLYETFEMKRNNTVLHKWGFIPQKFELIKIFTSIFIHANFLHLIGNMLFLWLVGCNIEDDWTWKVFLGLYIASGFFASLLHAIASSQSQVPCVGASGAIAGIMGAFMIRNYKIKIKFAYFFWILFRPLFGTVSIPAYIVLPFWFLQQLLGTGAGSESGVAYWAHIGGFVFGAIIGISFKLFNIEEKHIAPLIEKEIPEKPKISPEKIRQLVMRSEAGDMQGIVSSVVELKNLIDEEPENFQAQLLLARLYHHKGHLHDAIVMYNVAFNELLKIGNPEFIVSIYNEMKEKNIHAKLTERNLFNLGSFFEKNKRYEQAVKIFGFYIKSYRRGEGRPHAIYRVYRIVKNHLNNEVMAKKALLFLKKEYPDFSIDRKRSIPNRESIY